jgi:hypothetical protein
MISPTHSLETIIASVREAATAVNVAGDKLDLELSGLRSKPLKANKIRKADKREEPKSPPLEAVGNPPTSHNVPPHVQVKRNADGTLRYYYRRRGRPSRRLPDEPGSPEFIAAYHTAELQLDLPSEGALSFTLTAADPLAAPLLVLLAALKNHDRPGAEKIFAHLLMTASLLRADRRVADELLRAALAMVRTCDANPKSQELTPCTPNGSTSNPSAVS